MLKGLVKPVQNFSKSQVLHDEHESMDHSPDNKSPGSPMPESAE